MTTESFQNLVPNLNVSALTTPQMILQHSMAFQYHKKFVQQVSGEFTRTPFENQLLAKKNRGDEILHLTQDYTPTTDILRATFVEIYIFTCVLIHCRKRYFGRI